MCEKRDNLDVKKEEKEFVMINQRKDNRSELAGAGTICAFDLH